MSSFFHLVILLLCCTSMTHNSSWRHSWGRPNELYVLLSTGAAAVVEGGTNSTHTTHHKSTTRQVLEAPSIPRADLSVFHVIIRANSFRSFCISRIFAKFLKNNDSQEIGKITRGIGNHKSWVIFFPGISRHFFTSEKLRICSANPIFIRFLLTINSSSSESKEARSGAPAVRFHTTGKSKALVSKD